MRRERIDRLGKGRKGKWRGEKGRDRKRKGGRGKKIKIVKEGGLGGKGR